MGYYTYIFFKGFVNEYLGNTKKFSSSFFKEKKKERKKTRSSDIKVSSEYN